MFLLTLWLNRHATIVSAVFFHPAIKFRNQQTSMNLFLYFYCIVFHLAVGQIAHGFIESRHINMAFFHLNVITILEWFISNCYIEFQKTAPFIFFKVSYARSSDLPNFSSDAMQEIDCFVNAHSLLWILFRIEIESDAHPVCNLMNEYGQFIDTLRASHGKLIITANYNISMSINLCFKNSFPLAIESRTPQP